MANTIEARRGHRYYKTSDVPGAQPHYICQEANAKEVILTCKGRQVERTPVADLAKVWQLEPHAVPAVVVEKPASGKATPTPVEGGGK